MPSWSNCSTVDQYLCLLDWLLQLSCETGLSLHQQGSTGTGLGILGFPYYSQVLKIRFFVVTKLLSSPCCPLKVFVPLFGQCLYHLSKQIDWQCICSLCLSPIILSWETRSHLWNHTTKTRQGKSISYSTFHEKKTSSSIPRKKIRCAKICYCKPNTAKAPWQYTEAKPRYRKTPQEQNKQTKILHSLLRNLIKKVKFIEKASKKEEVLNLQE